MKTSDAVGKIGKNTILQTLLLVSQKLPETSKLNKDLKIYWSGNFALDVTFVKISGKCFGLFLCSDFVSLDLLYYQIERLENYYSWRKFLIKLKLEMCGKRITKFFVTDGKRGLHKAVSEIFPSIPLQLCTTHKQRRINQILPRVRGDGYDKLFSRLGHLAIRAPLKEIYQLYLNILLDFRKDKEFENYSMPRQEKLKKVIGSLRFQKSRLHTRYDFPNLIKDPTTNHLEGINSFLKERIKLIRGFKTYEHAELIIKLLIYYYRFHKFTSSNFKERNGKCPVELNQLNNQQLLTKIIKGNKPYSWIKNLIKPT